MEKLKLKNNKWKIFHHHEIKEKTSFLKNLTAGESFQILSDLYQIAIRSCPQRDLSIFHTEKTKTLSRIHSIFNRLIP